MSKKNIGILAAAILLIIAIVVGVFVIPRDVEEAVQVEDPAEEVERPVEDPVAEDELFTPIGTWPIVNEKIAMSIFTLALPEVENLDTNLETLWMEEKTGIHIDWLTSPPAGVSERVTLMLAAVDLPEVFMLPWGIITSDMIVRYGVEADMFLPLNELIETHMVNLPKHIDKYGIRGAITAIDGNIYGIPGWNDCFHCQYPWRFWMNHDWLKTLGMEPPETTEEFYQVLKAFRDNDPNRNGIADEIPLVGSLGAWHGSVIDFILNSFIFNNALSPTHAFLSVGEERIDTIVNKPQYREGLKFLNRLYKEGLLYPASFTQGLDELRALAAAGIVGSGPGGNLAQWIDPVTQGDIYGQFRPIAPLEGPDGVRQTTWFKYQPIIHNNFVITKAARHPEAAIRWADFRLNMENYLEMEKGIGRFGPSEPGDLGLDGRPALYRRLLPWPTAIQNVFWLEAGLTFLTGDYRLGEQADPGIDRYSAAGIEMLLFETSRDFMQPFTSQDYEILPPLQHLVEESEEIALLVTELQRYIDESELKFITGGMDINSDSVWQQHVDALDAMGLPRYLELRQIAYDRQFK